MTKPTAQALRAGDQDSSFASAQDTHRAAEKPVLSGHTPGPWLSGKPSSVVGWPVVAPAAMGRLICNVNYVHHSMIDPKVSGDDAFNRESRANAALIAAAPQLLEALNALLEVALGKTPNPAAYADTIAKADAALSAARAKVSQ